MPSLRAASVDAATPWFSSEYRDEGGQPGLVIRKLDGGAWFEMVYADGTRFLVDRRGAALWATWPEGATVEDTATYLLGPVMGFVLLLKGVHALHASAIAVGCEALALVGSRGAGKSTTAAAFAQRGRTVLSDDVVTLAPKHGRFLVQPAYPCLRLWPESARALFGAAEALPLLTPNWEKRYLDLAGELRRFQPEALPLAAIYLLGARSDDPAAPRVEAVPAGAAMIELVGNSYTPYLKDRDARAAEFEVLAQIAVEVPIRRVIPHADIRRIPALCDAILDDFATLTSRAAARESVPVVDLV